MVVVVVVFFVVVSFFLVAFSVWSLPVLPSASMKQPTVESAVTGGFAVGSALPSRHGVALGVRLGYGNHPGLGFAVLIRNGLAVLIGHIGTRNVCE